MRLAVTCSSFHKRDTLPCHFTEVFNIGTRLSEIRGQIASRYDHTVSEIVLFEGEIERGELVQTADPLDLDDTLLDIGVEPFTADEANDGDPTHTIYYDCKSTLCQSNMNLRLTPFCLRSTTDRELCNRQHVASGTFVTTISSQL